MAKDETHWVPTRREYVRYGGAVVGGGLLAGCTGGNESNESSGASTSVDASAATEAGTETGSATTGDDSYSVAMEPAGTVEFDAVPERWVAYKSGYGDMGISLGVGDGLVGTDRPSESFALLAKRFYSQLPGVELDFGDVANIRADGEAVDKEIFYEVDADLHLMDPNLPVVYFDWSDGDVAEVSRNVAPFFGNFIRRARDDAWGESYRSYTLYEAFEKVSRVFRRRERYDAFERLHEEVQSRIDDALPPVAERPSIALMNGGSDPANGTFYAMDPTAPGYEMKQYRDLGIKNAFEGVETGQYGETDYETLLEVDPEIIVFHWGVTYERDAFREQFVAPMLEDDVARELTAVREENLYPGGTAEQGPTINLFQTEMLAQQQYPEEFGEFPGLGETPEEEEQLFDRERVAGIINGEIQA
ncbi:ABC transporter substrate-binding protein [Halogeometricum luteum]|uniref:ABC transporter substrate-binding protein n=1 Tax=Halogeometricum luteum TaxID=2950537 RepID=A0ABU2G0Q0_9EURY|nr:ABC transporter substrate-binding protein [Halogeometricum sp. S3BR5-2]MDS0293738.1 ABC transporter substrate-binding protein [Halogeometricum sp. S3BR5-2]